MVVVAVVGFLSFCALRVKRRLPGFSFEIFAMTETPVRFFTTLRARGFCLSAPAAARDGFVSARRSNVACALRGHVTTIVARVLPFGTDTMCVRLRRDGVNGSRNVVAPLQSKAEAEEEEAEEEEEVAEAGRCR